MPQRISLLFLGIVLLTALPLLVLIARPFLTPFILALTLAIAINPAKNWLTARTRKPFFAALLTTFAAVLSIGFIFAFVGFAIFGELSSAYEKLSKRSMQEGGWPILISHYANRLIEILAARLPVDKEDIRAELLARMRTVTEYLLGHLGAAVGGVTSLLFTFVLVTLFLYLLLRHGESWSRRLAALLPLDPPTSARLFRKVSDSIEANVNGVLSVALAQALGLILGFWFLGVGSPVFWGTVGGLASVVPVLGAPLVWVPIAIGFVLTGAYGKAVILFLWGGLIVGSIDNVLRPVVVGKREKLHPLFIGLAMIGGTFAFGPLGLLVGPLVLSFSAAVFEEIQQLIVVERASAPVSSQHER